MLKDFKLPSLFGCCTQVCTEETALALRFPLAAYFIYMTTDPVEIADRQQLFRNFSADTALVSGMENVMEKLTSLAELARKLGSIQGRSNEELLYSLVELVVFVDTIELLDATYAEAENIRSPRLLDFFRCIRALTEDSQYGNLKNWLYGLESSMRSIRSLTLGVNLDAQLNVSEVGIVSINKQPYVSNRFLDRALREEASPAEFSCIAAVGIRETGSLLQRSQIVINREFYNAMNEITGGTLKNLRKYLTAEIQSAVLSLLSVEPELRFLTDALRYIRRLREYGLPLVYPAVSNRNTLQGLYDPLLAEKIPVKTIVPSSAAFSAENSIYILTGPNAGGKTVYLTAIGHAQLQFQLGLPVCAVAAEMRMYDTLLTHFVAAVQKESESRLVNETVRLKEVLEHLTPDTLFLLDETFSSTNAYDGLFLAEALIKYLLRVGCHCLYVTHLHSLVRRASEMQALGEQRVQLLSAKAEDGKRTYQILPCTGEPLQTSLAEDIIRENGLGFLLDP